MEYKEDIAKKAEEVGAFVFRWLAETMLQNMPTTKGDRLLNITEVAKHLGKAAKTVTAMRKSGRFPKADVIRECDKGTQKRFWRLSTVETWIDGSE